MDRNGCLGLCGLWYLFSLSGWSGPCRSTRQTEQPDKPIELSRLAEPLDWDLLPKGLLALQYDRTGDGVADHVTLHKITWSGWTAQPILEIEAHAQQDDQWVFIVDYDRDRFVYFAARTPLFAGNDPLAQVPFLTKEP